MKRIFLNIFIFFSLFFLPWYLSVTLVFLAIILRENYLESIFWGLLIDSVYAVSSPAMISGRFGFWTVLFFGLLIIRSDLRERIFIR